MLLRCIILACLVSLVGCGGDGLHLATVDGIVTLNGEPLAEARIVFYPEGGGRLSHAITDLDGSYSLVYVDGIRGALPGTHKVSISTFVEADPDSDDALIKMGQRELLPPQYNSLTTLTAELSPGQSEKLDFDLKAGK